MNPAGENLTSSHLGGYWRFSLRGLLYFTGMVAAWLALENHRHSDERVLEQLRSVASNGSARVLTRVHRSDSNLFDVVHWQTVGRIRLRFEGRIDPQLMRVTAELSAIDELSLAGCTNLHGTLKELTARHVPNIGTIVLSASDVDDSDLVNVTKITGLMSLDLSDCENVHGTGLSVIPVQHLNTLILDRSAASDASFAAFSRFRELRRLFVSNCEISGRAIREIGKLPKLQELDLSYTRIDDRNILYLRNLRHLKFLGLSGTAVTSQLFASLPTLQHIERLWIDHTNVLQDDALNLRSLTSLRLLRIDASQCDHTLCEHLQKLISLETLVIVGNPIDGAVFAKLRRTHPRLTVIHQSLSERAMRRNNPQEGKIKPNTKDRDRSDSAEREKR